MTAKHKLYGFTDVDRAPDAGYFIHFLDTACAEASVQAYKRHSFDLLKLADGSRVLDLGCGTGDDVREMARHVGRGQVVGVDSSEAMITEAQRRLVGTGLPADFRVADMQRLDFPDASFDGTRADRVFMHLEDPRQALREMIRITKPGGRVLVYEVDFETLLVDSPEKALTRKIVNIWCDGFRDGWRGRRLPAWFQDEGLVHIGVTGHTLLLNYELTSYLAGAATVERGRAAGLLTEAEGSAWLAELERLHKAGRLFASLSGFMVVGRKA
jgi:SAM-dependent methyltransferase